MTGRWRYEAEGGVAEEWWMEASGNTKVASFRWVQGGEVRVIELTIISEEEDGTFLRFKHYGPDFVPWEKNEPNVFKLESAANDRAVFRRVSESTKVPPVFLYERLGKKLRFRGTNTTNPEPGEGDLVILFERLG